jgi:2-polyprenyl-6-methoxyphenol hydroxylase-like FAD-dependent oxidoreductase
MSEINTSCCIAGGGPAGMMLGLLLSRAGVNVHVLEKHNDFLRDFRGDTVHPSTLELMNELGMLKEFLKLPHEKLKQIQAHVGDEQIILGDFSKVHAACPYIVFMPQWHFLSFLAQQAARFSGFHLEMNSEVVDLIEENDRVLGVIARRKDGSTLRIKADLTVAADGRTSIVRQKAGFEICNVGAPMDVLWMRISRKESDPRDSLGRLVAGAMMVLLNRGEYWQCAYLIPKGRVEEFRAEGIEKFRERIAQTSPFLADRVAELESFDEIKLLTVRVDYLNHWFKEGLLCIGDAAHAMSPVGGVGINLAVQDAVAAANILYKPLLEGNCSLHDLQKVQRRRMYPTRMTQRAQVFIQNHVITPTLRSSDKISVPWIMRAIASVPSLRAIPAQLIGIGLRPEHIHTPDYQRGGQKE